MLCTAAINTSNTTRTQTLAISADSQGEVYTVNENLIFATVLQFR